MIPVSGDDPDLREATVEDLRAAMAAGTLTSVDVTTGYVDRIARLDVDGPNINAVIELNPVALSIAASLDDERRTSGPRGPLHGIPVLIKDNIATADPMETTAGSLALVGHRPPRDAHLVRRLRDAGAVILGKSNLSEWANIRSSRSTSGWSARGGLTRNPYALDRNTSGSSSGSAAAVAANLCAVAIGTETDGSIVSPASINGLVGIKPTVGLVSRDGIIPISRTQDTAGPMARTVADAATLLAVIAGPDVQDPATTDAPSFDLGDVAALGADALDGARLGVVGSHMTGRPEVDALFDRTVARLADRGAILIDGIELVHGDAIEEPEFAVLLHELKHDLPRWFAEFVPDCGLASLADLVAWNRHHADREMPWFGQELFEAAVELGDLESPEYVEALATCRRLTCETGIDAAIAEHDLDALIAPTGGPAWMIDLVNGDNYSGSFSTPAAVAGCPHVTVPMGLVHGLPVGFSFVGPAWSERTLIGLAVAMEQIIQGRRPPTFARSSIPGV